MERDLARRCRKATGSQTITGYKPGVQNNTSERTTLPPSTQRVVNQPLEWNAIELKGIISSLFPRFLETLQKIPGEHIDVPSPPRPARADPGR